MEKVLLIGMNDMQIREINTICSQMHIGVICVNETQKSFTVKELLNLPFYKEGIAQMPLLKRSQDRMSLTKESLLLMSDFTEKHMDRLLLEVRRKNLMITYKAVGTKSNQEWTVNRLLAHMAFEKAQYEKLPKN